MKQIFNRICAETPKFFKRLRATGLSLAATGTSITVIPGVSEALKNIAAQSIVVGLVMAAVSQLTVNDTTQLKP